MENFISYLTNYQVYIWHYLQYTRDPKTWAAIMAVPYFITAAFGLYYLAKVRKAKRLPNSLSGWRETLVSNYRAIRWLIVGALPVLGLAVAALF